MKKTITLLCCLFLFLIAGCSTKSTYEPTDVKNVSISISNVSSTSATVIIKDTNTNSYMYGKWYCIEKEKNGEWYVVETVVSKYVVPSVGYLIDENDEVKFEIDWEWLYGELPQGHYRLLKEVNDQYISVEFNIE